MLPCSVGCWPSQACTVSAELAAGSAAAFLGESSADAIAAQPCFCIKPQAANRRHPVSGPTNELALQLLFLPAVLKGIDDLKAKGFRVDQMQVLMLAGMPLIKLGLPFLSRTAPITHFADCFAGPAPTQPATTLHCILYCVCSAGVPRYVPHCTALPCRTRS